MCMGLSVPAFAAESVNENAYPNVNYVDLEQLAEEFRGAPQITNVHVQKNVLTYVYENEFVCVTESFDSEGNQSLEFVRTNRTDLILVNGNENKVQFNNKEFHVSISTTPIILRETVDSSGTKWIFSSSNKIKIASEDALRTLTGDVAYTLMKVCIELAIGTSIPGAQGAAVATAAGLSISIAENVIKYFKNKNSDSKVYYVFRETWFEENYYAYKYVDKHYENENQTGFITSSFQEHWV